MRRSYGANASLCAIQEEEYGTKPDGNWERFSFMSSDISAEQTLIQSELLGSGREPGAPFRDVIKDEGTLVVPVEAKDFGRWLQFLLGDPVTAKASTPNWYTHTFVSGKAQLPSFSLEIGHTNVPVYFVHTGCMLDSMSFNFQRSGIASSTLKIIAQAENRYTTTQGGTVTSREYKPFSQFGGKITRAGKPLANVTGAEFTYSNGMEAVQTIRSDGLIESVDPTTISITGNIEARFGDTVLLDDAINGNAVEIEMGYVSGDFSLIWTFHEVYLPRPKVPISGPGGVQTTFNWQGAMSKKLAKSVMVRLLNDVASYSSSQTDEDGL